MLQVALLLLASCLCTAVQSVLVLRAMQTAPVEAAAQTNFTAATYAANNTMAMRACNALPAGSLVFQSARARADEHEYTPRGPRDDPGPPGSGI